MASGRKNGHTDDDILKSRDGPGASITFATSALSSVPDDRHLRHNTRNAIKSGHHQAPLVSQPRGA